MAIEINSKSEYYKSMFNLPVILGSLSIILIILSISIYLFLTYSAKKMTESIQEKENQSLELTQSITEKELEILPIKNRIASFKKLIKNHKTPLNVFAIIERNCFQNVWFSSFSFDFKEMTASLTGHTDDLFTVEDQTSYFKKDPLLSRVELSGVQSSEKDIDEEETVVGPPSFKFNLKVFFNPETFNN